MANTMANMKWPELKDLHNVSPPIEEIIPWRELPVKVIYKIKKIKKIGQKDKTILLLEDCDGEEVTVWPCARLLKDLEEDDKIAWVVSYGAKTSSLNPTRQFFDYMASH